MIYVYNVLFNPVDILNSTLIFTDFNFTLILVKKIKITITSDVFKFVTRVTTKTYRYASVFLYKVSLKTFVRLFDRKILLLPNIYMYYTHRAKHTKQYNLEAKPHN